MSTATGTNPADPAAAAETEVIDFCRDLIRFDTSNWGEGRSNGEREAADYCAAVMREAGLEPEIYESAPGRTSVVARMKGSNSELGALVVHGHLDVVPAQAQDWQVDPFAAEIRDGMIWGRGAVDMKDMNAMILAAMLRMHREGHQPQRDLIFAFFADEEDNGNFGAKWMVKHHPEVFDGATEAISEVGGFSTDVAGQRAYLIQTGEKGLHWTKMTASGTAGHGSAVHNDNPVVRLGAAVAAIGEHEWPLDYTKTTRALMEQLSELTGIPFDEKDPSKLLEATGSASKFIAATLRNTSNPTLLEGGYKHNVVPGSASALVDARTLPEQDEQVAAKLKELAGEKVSFELLNGGPSLEVPFSGLLVEQMVASLKAEDPESVVLPYMLGGGTDNKHLASLGISGYGFAPLQLPADMDFTGMFHGVDERVPLEALTFGVRVLHRFLAAQ
ncbi:M20/M25/M40 family metallo-hydrolase [Nesterenkonia jeotgali]|uniref:Acetylornithine deacetylase/succinyl-diaminopimelate desuccinylase-like protein n=1 Tax=Nesterenkonia jeotgali TaxID=317018 RepID=A0A839FGY2_9MICC|nr:M20/M25/M40 family metallo-hydrolase [Nesterenkonia jeotgali]MBA8920960.1 acetylornithine deacetylase/succinyl-diaminopimelate desuccinylase-like protein [Nesterenkonia jeotgali]